MIGSPLALADADYAKKAWVKFQDLSGLQNPQVKFVHGAVSSVDCEAKKATTIDNATKEATTHDYDYFLAATGLRRVWPVVPQSLSRKQYLLEAEEHIHAVTNAQHGVVVVGGGAVGIEMAAELKHVQPSAKVTLVHSRDKLLSSEDLSDECKDKSLELLKETGVDVLMSHRVAGTTRVETLDGSTKYELEFTNGHKMFASQVIMAVSKSVATSSYLPSSAVDEEGYVKIQAKYVTIPCATREASVSANTASQPAILARNRQQRAPLLRRRPGQVDRHQARRRGHARRTLRGTEYPQVRPEGESRPGAVLHGVHSGAGDDRTGHRKDGRRVWPRRHRLRRGRAAILL